MERGPKSSDRTRNGLIVGIAVIGAVVVLLIGALFAVLLWPDDDQRATGPRTLREPIRMQQVVETAPPPCAQGMLAEAKTGTCYRLGGNTITVRRVDGMRAKLDPTSSSTGWTIEIRLTSADAVAFADLTRRVSAEPEGTPARQIAIIAGTEILSAPAVIEPLTTGEVSITGGFRRDTAEGFVRRFTGS